MSSSVDMWLRVVGMRLFLFREHLRGDKCSWDRRRVCGGQPRSSVWILLFQECRPLCLCARIDPAMTHVNSLEILLVIDTMFCPGTEQTAPALAGLTHLLKGPAYVALVVHRKALLGDQRGRQH